ncbi:MAG: MerR family DNA-binding protein [Proteobacteria bacterium]|nr:MerR family DNA-binding protein [Pseudomonadota bacterium]
MANGRSGTIGTIARRAGVGVETVRYYERRGLIEQPPRPSSGGTRTYPAETVERLKFIRHAKEIGFSLREVADLLDLRADPAAECSEVRRRAERKREEVRDKIDRLLRMERALDVLIQACPADGPAQRCTILGALDDAGAGHSTAQSSLEEDNGDEETH